MIEYHFLKLNNHICTEELMKQWLLCLFCKNTRNWVQRSLNRILILRSFSFIYKLFDFTRKVSNILILKLAGPSEASPSSQTFKNQLYKLCQNLPKFVKFCQKLSKFPKIWQFCQILSNLPKFCQICQNLSKLAKFY